MSEGVAPWAPTGAGQPGQGPVSTDQRILAELSDLRAENAHMAEEVDRIQRRTRWLMLLTVLLFLFGGCGTQQSTDLERLIGSGDESWGSYSPDGFRDSGGSVQETLADQCYALGRIARQVGLRQEVFDQTSTTCQSAFEMGRRGATSE